MRSRRFASKAASKANAWVLEQQRAALAAVSSDFAGAMGFAGGDRAVEAITRRVFASRMVGKDVQNSLGLRHSKGLLLHGPPGTGKTLLARGIGAVLSARPPKLVKGPEIFSHLLGASEEAIRRLFKAADDEWARAGENSALHVIVLDEVDSILRRRGSGSSDGSGAAARDGVVNQLLAKLDGLSEQNNLLVIATTNRIDLIDPAALRPGRLDVQIELDLPTEEGRRAILAHHAARLDPAVLRGAGSASAAAGATPAHGGFSLVDGECATLDELAKTRTVNFSGAELEAVVRNAASFALERALAAVDAAPLGEGLGEGLGERLVLTPDDMFRSADEITPMFGSSTRRRRWNRNSAGDAEPWRVDRSGDAQWVEARGAARACAARVVAADAAPPQRRASIAIVGPRGAGKRDLAAQVLAEEESFVFERVVDAALFESLDVERARSELVQLFADATRATRSAIVLRDVDLLRPELRTTLLALMRAEDARASASAAAGSAAGSRGGADDPAERRLLVIATVNASVGAARGRSGGEVSGAAALFDEHIMLQPGALAETDSIDRKWIL